MKVANKSNANPQPQRSLANMSKLYTNLSGSAIPFSEIQSRMQAQRDTQENIVGIHFNLLYTLLTPALSPESNQLQFHEALAPLQNHKEHLRFVHPLISRQ